MVSNVRTSNSNYCEDFIQDGLVYEKERTQKRELEKKNGELANPENREQLKKEE